MAIKEPYEKMREDIALLLQEDLTIYRPTITKGSLGEVIASSSENYSIKGSLQQITNKDFDIHSMGLADPGNAKAYFKHRYTSDDDSSISGTFAVANNDLVKDANETYWRIVQMAKGSKYGNNEIFKKVVVRRLE